MKDTQKLHNLKRQYEIYMFHMLTIFNGYEKKKISAKTYLKLILRQL